MLHHEVTDAIIGASMRVLNTLKPGLDEKLYERALVIELRDAGFHIAQQQKYPVHYRGHLIGELIPDLIIDGKVLVETKVVTGFTDCHVAQVLGYLNITELQVALLLNFKEATLEFRRIGTDRRRTKP
jgi:GxxExxY protein